MLPIFGSDTLLKRTIETKKRNCDLQFLLVLLIRFYCMGKQHIECVLLCSLIYTILNYTTGRKFFKDQPELLRRYERNEARYILQLPKNYDTISIDFGIDKNELKRLVIALAELDLTIDEWLCFKMKELILANRLSKENRGEE